MSKSAYGAIASIAAKAVATAMLSRKRSYPVMRAEDTSWAPPGQYVKSGRRGRRSRKRYRRNGRSRKKARFGKKRRARSLSSRLRKLEKRVQAGIGTYIYKYRGFTYVQANVNNQNMSANMIGVTALEGSIDSLPHFNPALPGTYTFVDYTSGTQHKELEFAVFKSSFVAKNNYELPAVVDIWCVVPKEDTSITALQAVTNGLTDVGSGLGATTTLVHPKDSPQFKDLYHVVGHKSKTLYAGQSLFMSHSVKPFIYDPSFIDNHNQEYQKKYGGHGYLIRVRGVLGHDDVTVNLEGITGARVDITRQCKFVIKYEAGADIEYLEVDDNPDTFTSVGIAALPVQPVKDSNTYP